MIHIAKHNRYATLTFDSLPSDFWDGFPEVKGKSVFIKPNLVSPLSSWDFPSTTHVSVTSLIVQKVLSEGADRVVVGECGFKDQWDKTLKSTDYEMLTWMYPKVEIIPLQDGANFHKFSLRRLDNYRSLYGVKFSDYLLECEIIINLPKMKVHSMAGMTEAIKNMMGTMAQKGSMHPRANVAILHKRLADLYQLTSKMVNFIVMDGIEGAEYAEQCGHRVRSQVLISGTDQWEVDVAACKLMGINPQTIPYLKYIRTDFDSISVPLYLIKNYELPLAYRGLCM